MASLPSSAVVLVLVVVQVGGLASAWLARISEGSHRQGMSQWLFLICLAAAGLATIASLQLNVGGWFLSGTSLSLMVLGATCDFRCHRPTTAH